jgi:elongation factor P
MPPDPEVDQGAGGPVSVSTNDFKNGMTLDLDGTLFQVVEFQHVKPGKGGAFVRTKLRNVKTGAVLERTFNAGVKVGLAIVERKEMQYLFRDDDQLTFMDLETYEQLPVPADVVGDAAGYLAEGSTAQISVHQDVPIAVELPASVALSVTQTQPAVKGDTRTNAMKPATLETGAVVQVPLFVGEGERVKVDTRTGAYIERVK